MKKCYIILSFILMLILNSSKINASQIMGADIEYTCVGVDSFKIIVKIYKDCKGVSVTPISLSIEPLSISCSWGISGATMQQLSCEEVTPVCSTSCSKCNKNSCNTNGYPNGSNCSFQIGIEKLTFSYLLVFPSNINLKCCKFRISFEQCCRSGQITTCCAGENFYSYAELNRCIAPCNSSPKFIKDPESILCARNCICLNNGAIDTTDFDSMSYSLVPPLIAYGSYVSYNGTYSYLNPLSYKGFPKTKPNIAQPCSGFVLDSTDGSICFTPITQQVSNLAIAIKEWRKDTITGKMVNIGMVRRDLQLIVFANCNNAPPIISGPYTQKVCVGDSVKFSNMKVMDSDTLGGIQRDSVKITISNSFSNAVFTKYQNGKNENWNLDWLTTAADIPNGVPKTYYFNIIADDNNCPAVGRTFQQFAITVSPQPTDTHSLRLNTCGKLAMNAFPTFSYKVKPTYTWQVPYPGGNIYNSKDTTVQVNQIGWTKVLHTITDNNCSNSYIDSVYVSSFPLISLPSDTTICKGDSLSIKATYSNTSNQFKIYWNNDTAIKGTLLPIKVFKDTTIMITLEDSSGCVVNDYINVYISKSIALNLDPDKVACQGDTINILVKQPIGAYSSIKWYETSTGNLVDTGLMIRTTKTNSYMAVKTDIYGCKVYDSINTNIYDPKVSISDTTICEGDSMVYQAVGFTTYNWNNQSIKPTFTVFKSGKYFVTVQEIHGCFASDTFILSTNPKNNFSLGNDTVVCSGVPVFFAIPKMAGAKYYYNNVLFSDTHTVYIPGNYIVSCVTSAGCVSQDTINIINLPSPDASFVMIPSSTWNNYYFISNDSNLKSYLWLFGDNANSTKKNPQHSYNSSGNYIVYAIVTDSNNCSSTFSDTLVVINGIKSAGGRIPIYIVPNPASTSFSIMGMEDGQYILTDIQGRMVLNGTVQNNQSIDISQIPTGVYILLLNNEVLKITGRTLLIKE